MRKLSATLLVSLLAITAANAQNEGRAVRFGIKAAGNMAYVKPPDMKEFDGAGSTFGYTFGLLSDFIIGADGKYAFSSGVLLNNIGGKFTAPSNVAGVEDLESTLHLRYIEVPVTMKLKTSEIGYMTYYGQVGVSTAFNIRAKADFETVDPTNNNAIVLIEDEDIADNTALFKAALVIGAGFEYNFSGNTSLLVGVTYNGGFTNLFDGEEYIDEDGETQDVKVLANYIELTTGVFF